MFARLTKAILALLLTPLAWSQVTTVEVYGDVPAAQAYNGLGTNITSTNAWEYSAAQTAHITWGRFDCGWNSVEVTKGSYTLPSPCSTGFSSSGTYGVHPVADALFGPSTTTIALATITSNTSLGATTVTLTVTSGSLSGVVPGQTELYMSPTQWSTKASWRGALVTGISGSTLTMASAAQQAFTAGTTAQVDLDFYPPVFIPPNQGYKAYQSNPSIQAYAAYVHYLQTQIQSAGLTGQVSIWNEPPNGYDPWDQAGNYYDTPPANGYIQPGAPGLGIELPLYLANLGTAVAGVPLDNGYTEVTGLNGSLWYYMIPWMQNLFTVKSIYSTESFHPYGNNPEDAMWLGNSCLTANLANYTNLLNNCTPTGGVVGAAMKMAVASSMQPHNFGGLQPSITETGTCRCNSPTPSETQVTRFNLRQFLGFQALNVTPVMFYRMAGDTNWEWLHSDHSAYPVYTAFQGLMTDISAIAQSPVAPYSACMMPRVSSYTSTSADFPLASMTLVGSQGSNRANSLLYFTWVRTYGVAWNSVASPAAVNASVVIPNGLTVSSVKDTQSGSSVSFTFVSHVLTYPVTDNPIEVLLVPVSSTTPPTLTCT